MEKVVTLDPRAWAGKRVFLTGHTGFKGSWLALWLRQLGADVTGYSLAPETHPNLFTLAEVESALAGHTLGDIRDADALRAAMTAARPDVVFHLAAQPLVRASYNDPVGTYATNVMGTVNVLEAARGCTNLSAIVVATTDKCYDNREWAWGYRETDALGGHDPYSASKACAELVAASYRRAFFANGPLLAMRGQGWRLAGLATDTAMMAYLVAPDQRSYALADLTLRHLKRELRQEVADDQAALFETGDEVAETAMLHARAVIDLAAALQTELEERGGTRLLEDIELPLVEVLVGMEATGIAVDQDLLAGLEAEFADGVRDAAADAYAVFNATGVRVRDYPLTLDKILAGLSAA